MTLAVQIVLEMRFEATPDGRVWTRTTNAYDFWQRYLSVFDEVDVLARVRPIAAIGADARRTDGPGVRFVHLPYYIGPLGFLPHLPEVWRALRLSLSRPTAAIYRIPSMLGEIGRNSGNGQRPPFGIEVVGDPHDVFAPEVLRHPLRPFFRWFFTRHLGRFCRQATAVAYVNETRLRKRYPPDAAAFVTSYSSVELPEEAFRVPMAKQTLMGHTHIVFVGSLAQNYKGADVLIDAVHECLAQGLDLTVTIIGEGLFRERLETQAHRAGMSERVRFLGQLPAGEAVRRELDVGDLFVLPARTEGLPRVVIETMARGKPCISTTVGGIPELLWREDLVPPNDSAALAKKIMEVVRDPSRMQRMALRNYDRARQYHKKILDSRRHEFYSQLRSRTEQWLEEQGDC